MAAQPAVPLTRTVYTATDGFNPEYVSSPDLAFVIDVINNSQLPQDRLVNPTLDEAKAGLLRTINMRMCKIDKVENDYLKAQTALAKTHLRLNHKHEFLLHATSPAAMRNIIEHGARTGNVNAWGTGVNYGTLWAASLYGKGMALKMDMLHVKLHTGEHMAVGSPGQMDFGRVNGEQVTVLTNDKNPPDIFVPFNHGQAEVLAAVQIVWNGSDMTEPAAKLMRYHPKFSHDVRIYDAAAPARKAAEQAAAKAAAKAGAKAAHAAASAAAKKKADARPATPNALPRSPSPAPAAAPAAAAMGAAGGAAGGRMYRPVLPAPGVPIIQAGPVAQQVLQPGKQAVKKPTTKKKKKEVTWPGHRARPRKNKGAAAANSASPPASPTYNRSPAAAGPLANFGSLTYKGRVFSIGAQVVVTNWLSVQKSYHGCFPTAPTDGIARIRAMISEHDSIFLLLTMHAADANNVIIAANNAALAVGNFPFCTFTTQNINDLLVYAGDTSDIGAAAAGASAAGASAASVYPVPVMPYTCVLCNVQVHDQPGPWCNRNVSWTTCPTNTCCACEADDIKKVGGTICPHCVSSLGNAWGKGQAPQVRPPAQGGSMAKGGRAAGGAASMKAPVPHDPFTCATDKCDRFNFLSVFGSTCCMPCKSGKGHSKRCDDENELRLLSLAAVPQQAQPVPPQAHGAVVISDSEEKSDEKDSDEKDSDEDWDPKNARPGPSQSSQKKPRRK